MNILGYIFSFLINEFVLGVLFLMALFALFFPGGALSFKKKMPIIFYLILFFAVAVQFPVWFGGLWGIGIKYLEQPVSARVTNILLLVVPLLYVLVFAFSSFMQSKKNSLSTISFGISFFTSLILAPFLYFLLVYIICDTAPGKALIGRLFGV